MSVRPHIATRTSRIYCMNIICKRRTACIDRLAYLNDLALTETTKQTPKAAGFEGKNRGSRLIRFELREHQRQHIAFNKPVQPRAALKRKVHSIVTARCEQWVWLNEKLDAGKNLSSFRNQTTPTTLQVRDHVHIQLYIDSRHSRFRARSNIGL